jgi:hypothetical protein
MQPARADIYTWVDAAGRVNISNIDPPEDARVTSVVKSGSVAPASRTDQGRDAEVQALAERVRQLQDAVDQARRQAQTPIQYQSAPPPPMQYLVDSAPPAPQYADYAAPQTMYGCDPSWGYCPLWWGAGVYPAGIVVVRAPFRHFYPGHGGHRVAPPQPLRASGGTRRR